MMLLYSVVLCRDVVVRTEGPVVPDEEGRLKDSTYAYRTMSIVGVDASDDADDVLSYVVGGSFTSAGAVQGSAVHHWFLGFYDNVGYPSGSHFRTPSGFETASSSSVVTSVLSVSVSEVAALVLGDCEEVPGATEDSFSFAEPSTKVSRCSSYSVKMFDRQGYFTSHAASGTLLEGGDGDIYFDEHGTKSFLQKGRKRDTGDGEFYILLNRGGGRAPWVVTCTGLGDGAWDTTASGSLPLSGQNLLGVAVGGRVEVAALVPSPYNDTVFVAGTVYDVNSSHPRGFVGEWEEVEPDSAATTLTLATVPLWLGAGEATQRSGFLSAALSTTDREEDPALYAVVAVAGFIGDSGGSDVCRVATFVGSSGNYSYGQLLMSTNLTDGLSAPSSACHVKSLVSSREGNVTITGSYSSDSGSVVSSRSMFTASLDRASLAVRWMAVPSSKDAVHTGVDVCVDDTGAVFAVGNAAPQGTGTEDTYKLGVYNKLRGGSGLVSIYSLYTLATGAPSSNPTSMPTGRPTLSSERYDTKLPSSMPTSAPSFSAGSIWYDELIALTESMPELHPSLTSHTFTRINVYEDNVGGVEEGNCRDWQSFWASAGQLGLSKATLSPRSLVLGRRTGRVAQAVLNDAQSEVMHCNNATEVGALLESFPDKIECGDSIWRMKTCGNARAVCVAPKSKPLACDADPCADVTLPEYWLSPCADDFQDMGAHVLSVVFSDTALPAPPIVTVLEATEAQIESLTLNVSVTGPSGLLVHCLADALPRPATADHPPSVARVREAGSVAALVYPEIDTANASASVLILGLTPLTDYEVHCVTLAHGGALGSSLTQANMEVTAGVFSTIGPKTVTVTVLGQRAQSAVTHEAAVRVSLSHPPSPGLGLLVTLSTDKDAIADAHALHPRLLSFFAASSHVDRTLSHEVAIHAIESGAHTLSATLDGSAAAEFVVIYENAIPTVTVSSTHLEPDVPELASAQYSSDGSLLVIRFSWATDHAGLPSAFDCADLLDVRPQGEQSARLDELPPPTCTWVDDATVAMELATPLVPGIAKVYIAGGADVGARCYPKIDGDQSGCRQVIKHPFFTPPPPPPPPSLLRAANTLLLTPFCLCVALSSGARPTPRPAAAVLCWWRRRRCPRAPQ
jgi:hypothetical protein